MDGKIDFYAIFEISRYVYEDPHTGITFVINIYNN